MNAIAPGIRGLRIAFVNVFAVSHSDGSWTLIDAGVPFSETLIQNWAEKSFKTPPNSIVLTHGHFDHVSCAFALAKRWNVDIYAHPLEFPYLTGKQEYPAPNPGAGGLMSLLSPLYPRGPVDLGERLRALPLSSGDRPATITELPGWQVHHTPGHTPGHVSLFRPHDRALLVGDAFCTTKPESFFEAAIAQQPELHGPPAYFTWDWDLAKKSVMHLAALNPNIVVPGHGKPMSGEELPGAVRKLAAHFDEVAVPRNRSAAAG
jgi:glyoxylase-like metal-dependent hydrolase (beta-lactamase superfamily II)